MVKKRRFRRLIRRAPRFKPRPVKRWKRYNMRWRHKQMDRLTSSRGPKFHFGNDQFKKPYRARRFLFN